MKMWKGHFPEKAMSKVTGHDTQSLRALAVALSRACIFGDTMFLRPNAQNHTNTHTLHHLNGPVASHKPGSSSNNCHSMGVEF